MRPPRPSCPKLCIFCGMVEGCLLSPDGSTLKLQELKGSGGGSPATPKNSQKFCPRRRRLSPITQSVSHPILVVASLIVSALHHSYRWREAPRFGNLVVQPLASGSACQANASFTNPSRPLPPPPNRSRSRHPFPPRNPSFSRSLSRRRQRTTIKATSSMDEASPTTAATRSQSAESSEPKLTLLS